MNNGTQGRLSLEVHRPLNDLNVDNWRRYREYEDRYWEDLLTRYYNSATGENVSITYDEIGNPLNWRDNMRFSWQGRQLLSVQKGSSSLSFGYDADGVRVKKTVSGVTTQYYVQNGVCYGESRSNGKSLQYLFDETGRVIGLRYHIRDTLDGTYYFVFNGQGDVIQIIDAADGQVMANYTYDARRLKDGGNVLSATNGAGTTPSAEGIAAVNPFRYRGYYYDQETGLYYLQSRYYDPQVGRFLNADSIIDSDAGMLGYNLFAYCGNNPVNRTDPSGMFWKEIGDWFNKTWNSVTTWASNTFGVETSTTVIEAQNKEKEELDFLFFKISKAENVSYDIETGSSKAVTVYANTTSPKVGIKANVGNVTGNIGTGLDGLLTEKLSIKSQDTTYSFGYSEKVLWSDFSFAISSGNYSQTYTLELNKWRIALAATAPYLLPISNSEHLVRVFN